jgi:hypothetical protein
LLGRLLLLKVLL